MLRKDTDSFRKGVKLVQFLRGPSSANCSVSNGQKPISNILCDARPTETLLGHFSEAGAGRLSGELSVGMETKQKVKIGYHYDRFIFRINGRLQSLQWHSKSETICLGMPEHSIYRFLVSYLRK